MALIYCKSSRISGFTAYGITISWKCCRSLWFPYTVGNTDMMGIIWVKTVVFLGTLVFLCGFVTNGLTGGGRGV